jgi:hypothetical protein
MMRSRELRISRLLPRHLHHELRPGDLRRSMRSRLVRGVRGGHGWKRSSRPAGSRSEGADGQPPVPTREVVAARSAIRERTPAGFHDRFHGRAAPAWAVDAAAPSSSPSSTRCRRARPAATCKSSSLTASSNDTLHPRVHAPRQSEHHLVRCRLRAPFFSQTRPPAATQDLIPHRVGGRTGPTPEILLLGGRPRFL